MEQKITWTALSGSDIEITVSLLLEKELWADGDRVKVPCCEIEILARADGKIIGSGRPEPVGKNKVGAVARIGGLGILPENLARVEAAIAEFEATPEWQAKVKKQKNNEAEYKREYARKISQGWCPKCGTYCYGDCEAN